MQEIFQKHAINLQDIDANQNHTFMGFDYGTKRIGVAYGNLITKSASSAGIIHYQGRLDRFNQLKQFIDEYKPNYIIVGLSFYSDGQIHDITRACINFGLDINRYFNIPVIWVDERYSTVNLDKAKEYVDDKSAIIVLEQFLNTKQKYYIKL